MIKELGLSFNRREWTIEDKERYSSLCFEKGVKLIKGLFESPLWDYKSKALPYWNKVEENIKKIKENDLIHIYRNCAIFDQRKLEGYIDPRCWLRTLQELHDVEQLNPFTLTEREVWRENEYKGKSYTLGTIPLHSKQKDYDYVRDGVFKRLSELEKELDPNAEGWGGRSTVGGSGWNTPSKLPPYEVIDTILMQILGENNV